MVTTREEKKSRQRIASEKMTDAQRVQHKLRSGPIKSELRTVPETLLLTKAFFLQAKEAIEAYPSLNAENGFALVIAYLTPDLSAIFTKSYKPGKETEIAQELSSMCCIPAGLIFGIRDPEHNGDWLIGDKPFLATPLVISALRQRIESDVIGIN